MRPSPARAARPAAPPFPMMLRRRALGALAAALLALAPAAGAQRAAPRLAIATWGTEQGLPSSSILDVHQTSDGFLWLATYEGLVRFDGVAFRTFGSDEIPGLQRGSFTAFATDAAGRVWAVSETGELVHHERGRWTVARTTGALPPDRVTAMLAPRDGSLWVGSPLGLWRVHEGRITPVAMPPGVGAPAVSALALAPDGAVLVGTAADGVWRHEGGAMSRLWTEEGPGARIESLHVDPDGTLWVGTYGDGVVRLSPSAGGEVRATRVGATGDAVPRQVNAFGRDGAGTLWLAAENGLFALRDGRLEPVPLTADGAPMKAETLHTDADGNLWVGTRQSGLFRLRAASVATLGTDEGLPHAFTFAVASDGADGVWVATQEGAVHRPRALVVAPAHSVVAREHMVRDVLRDRRGDVWLATAGGLTRVPGGRADDAVTYTTRDGLADDRVRALHAARDGTLWAATNDGLASVRDGVLRTYGRAEGLTDHYPLSVYEDARGTLWVGTRSAGLFRRGADGRFVAGPDALRRQPVFRISEDADGTLWIGTAHGLARLHRDDPRGRVAFVGTRHGLPGATVFQALDDARGSLWLTGPWGIARVSRRALHAVADGRARTLTATRLGRGDGMAVQEASSIGRSWRAPDGRLWFPTPGGVAVVDPSRLARQPVPTAALVEQVVADGEITMPDTVGDAALVLAPGTRTLELRFTAPTFVAPSALRFRWRLEGFDPDWVDGGTRRVAYYANLSPGAYRFLVQVRAGDGPWTDDGAAGPRTASLALSLRPHPWQTRWFAALVVLLVGALGAAAFRLRMRAVSRATARAAREELLRAMSMRDELTGLYNRRGMLMLAEQAVRTAARERRGFTLLFADLDGLKPVNDTLGHAMGDQLLVDAANVLRATFREVDVVARLGGDEFAVLLPDPPHADAAGAPAPESADAVCARLMASVARHGAANARPYRLALSLGTSRYDPDAPRPLDALMADADHSMYVAKRRKRGAGARG